MLITTFILLQSHVFINDVRRGYVVRNLRICSSKPPDFEFGPNVWFFGQVFYIIAQDRSDSCE